MAQNQRRCRPEALAYDQAPDAALLDVSLDNHEASAAQATRSAAQHAPVTTDSHVA
jgi:hypothetical protein